MDKVDGVIKFKKRTTVKIKWNGGYVLEDTLELRVTQMFKYPVIVDGEGIILNILRSTKH